MKTKVPLRHLYVRMNQRHNFTIATKRELNHIRIEQQLTLGWVVNASDRTEYPVPFDRLLIRVIRQQVSRLTVFDIVGFESLNSSSSLLYTEFAKVNFYTELSDK